MNDSVKKIFGSEDRIQLHDAMLKRRKRPAALIRVMHVLNLDKKTLAKVLSVSYAFQWTSRMDASGVKPLAA